MSGRRKLIVVSNRGPVTYTRENGARVARRGGGGLVTALRGLVAHHDVTWIASAISEEDRALAAESGGEAVDETLASGSAFRLRLVAHDETAYDWYYNVVSNPMLWFLQHYLWELAYTPSLDIALQNAWDEGYVRVNEGFADAVIEELELEPDTAVFFHDYHLYLAPRYVRERAPEALLAHFIHIPWPQTDYWHVLPDPIRRAIHEGLLANDAIGFHTHRWKLNFLRAASDLAGADCNFLESVVDHDGRRTLATVHPISIDPAEFEELAQSERVLAAERELVARRPERLILRVDRTDPSKNIVRGFRAYELYLEAHPESRGRVGMLALLDRSRVDIPEYSEYVAAIQREARRVNDRFQQNGWTPLEVAIEDDFLGALAAYKQFDVLLVNAIFDGLNLVSKEAPLLNERDGVVILSENAGAHEELGEWALSVNPFDVAGQAEALHQALSMPLAERRERIEAIRAQVREHDVASWVEGQLADLDRCAGNALLRD
ncbi:MAG TPA: trehalose-6-phosphate synthase [Gaiellaceae bacterium]|nr:trehalose-6-phosphate synthase [Gaiellaceae bacterium]